jgi:hypothetical protein
MKNIRHAALAAAAAVAALGLGACQDADAVAKAEAAAKAKREASAQADRLKARAAHNVDCITALRWQKAALAGAGIGPLRLYEDHYAGQLDQALGDGVIAGEGGAPALSRATLQDYLDWAYAQNVRTKFTAGRDEDQDGTVSPGEKHARGFNMVAACVLAVAEAGKGPLAGNDKVGRVAKIDMLRARLKPKDA